MKKHEVELGGLYVCRVSGRFATIKILCPAATGHRIDRTPAPEPYGSFPSGFLCGGAGSSRQDRLSLFSLSAFSGLRDGPAFAGASEVGDARPHQDFMANLPRSVFTNRAASTSF